MVQNKSKWTTYYYNIMIKTITIKNKKCFDVLLSSCVGNFMPVSLSKIKLNLIKIVSPSRIFENKFVASTEISLLNVKLVLVGRFRMYLR